VTDRAACAAQSHRADIGAQRAGTWQGLWCVLVPRQPLGLSLDRRTWATRFAFNCMNHQCCIIWIIIWISSLYFYIFLRLRFTGDLYICYFILIILLFISLPYYSIAMQPLAQLFPSGLIKFYLIICSSLNRRRTLLCNLTAFGGGKLRKEGKKYHIKSQTGDIKASLADVHWSGVLFTGFLPRMAFHRDGVRGPEGGVALFWRGWPSHHGVAQRYSPPLTVALSYRTVSYIYRHRDTYRTRLES